MKGMSVRENVKKIHDASMRILQETGMRFYHRDAIKVLKEQGIRVERDIAYFTEEQIMCWVKQAPSEALLYAANPRYDMKIGGDHQYVGPCGGATFIMDREGHMRDAVFSDFIKLIKLFEGNPDYCLNGGLACQPKDIPVAFSVILLALASLTHTEKCMFAAAGDYRTMETLIRMTCIRFGVTPEQLREEPRLCTIANTNTPLLLDKNMTETIFTMAKYGQPVIIASAAMAGTTSPVTLAGTLAIVNAEIIASVALAQMVSPGTPVIYGSQSTAADMATCSIAIGSPEGALCYKYCAEMAKFYGIPSRAGGSLTDAKLLNAQAGYEAMLTCMACKESGINIMTQSAGIMNSYLAVSYEKLITDFEIISFVNRYLRDIEVNDETIPMELIKELKQEGQYLTEEHTLEFCRKELCIPKISVRGPHAEPAGQFDRNIEKQLRRLEETYQKPEISDQTAGAIKEMLLDMGAAERDIDMAMDI